MKKSSLFIFIFFGALINLNAQEAGKDSTEQGMTALLNRNSETENHFLRREIQRKILRVDSVIVCRIPEAKKMRIKNEPVKPRIQNRHILDENTTKHPPEKYKRDPEVPFVKTTWVFLKVIE